MLGLSCKIASTSGGRRSVDGRSVDGRSVDGGGGSGVLSPLGKNLSKVCWTCCPNGKDDGEEDIDVADDSSIVLSLMEDDSWTVLSYTNVQGCKSALLKSFFFAPSPLLS